MLLTWDRVRRLHAEGELKFAVAGTLGNWMALVGERAGVPALKFNRLRFADWHHRSLETAPIVVDGLLSLYSSIANAIDLGCGTGVYVDELRKRGVRAVGYEQSAGARRVARRAFGLDLHPFELSGADVGGGYDICLCLEVAHYLTPKGAEQLVASCARAAPLIAFSSPLVLEHGRIAGVARARAHWMARFAPYDMRFLASETAWLEHYLRNHISRNQWIADNISLFTRLSAIG
jgi:SAM-dependent methyltransferase